MDIKTMPLSRMAADPTAALVECADSGSVVVVALPDQRLVAIQPLDATEDDDVINAPTVTENLASLAVAYRLALQGIKQARLLKRA